jgi:hypothetical protein
MGAVAQRLVLGLAAAAQRSDPFHFGRFTIFADHLAINGHERTVFT